VEGMVAEMTSWQAIDTAPKDGTKIFIWRKEWNCAPVAWRDVIDGKDGVFGAWAFDDTLCFGVSDGILGWQEDIDDGCMPTHWMPIPESPND
jgi:hypothetical protein